jgi:hypothetical protein
LGIIFGLGLRETFTMAILAWLPLATNRFRSLNGGQPSRSTNPARYLTTALELHCIDPGALPGYADLGTTQNRPIHALTAILRTELTVPLAFDYK